MRELKRTYYFFTGQGQYAPKWLCKLPHWFQPLYQGNSTWRWLGISIKADSIGGESLLMYWRRRVKQRLQRRAR